MRPIKASFLRSPTVLFLCIYQEARLGYSRILFVTFFCYEVGIRSSNRTKENAFRSHRSKGWGETTVSKCTKSPELTHTHNSRSEEAEIS